jgi:hypothetical protein
MWPLLPSSMCTCIGEFRRGSNGILHWVPRLVDPNCPTVWHRTAA